MSANGSAVFLTSFNFGDIARPGGFEGRAALSPVDGRLLWANDCHGDSYSAIPIGNVLYSVGHAHDCAPAGYFPHQVAWHRALAETLTATHTNGPPTAGYTSHQGEPASDQLVWYPTIEAGTFTGKNQGAWSVTGNANYVSLGGEFPVVNGKAQQGLARFAIRAAAPNAVAPQSLSGFAPTLTGKVVAFKATWDMDNRALTYRVYRDGGITPVYSTTVDSTFWSLPTVSFTDSAIVADSSHTYRVTATDPLGNLVSSPSRTIS